MRRGERRPRRSGGFTYLGLLFLVVLIGLLLAAAGEVTRTAVQRNHEAELLWVGHQYREAIAGYVAHYHRYPAALADLLGPSGADTSSGSGAAAGGAADPLVFRALRRLYRDPITNSTDWTAVPAPDGSIMGVASTSTQAPRKVAGFDSDDEDFDKAETYADWKFSYVPEVAGRSGRVGRRP
jgi:type II secretory pathway pseudopilin PulG